MEENKDAITRMDITLHDKSQDMTDARIRLDNRNLYGMNENSQSDISPDFMKAELNNHGKSYDIIDSKFSQKHSIIDTFLDENALSSRTPHINHSATSVNPNKNSIIKKSSGNQNHTSIDNLSYRKDGSINNKSDKHVLFN